MSIVFEILPMTVEACVFIVDIIAVDGNSLSMTVNVTFKVAGFKTVFDDSIGFGSEVPEVEIEVEVPLMTVDVAMLKVAGFKTLYTVNDACIGLRLEYPEDDGTSLPVWIV